MPTKPSLHLARPAEPESFVSLHRALDTNLRTVEHYRLTMGEDAAIDPDFPGDAK
jgi:hypothetical protein